MRQAVMGTLVGLSLCGAIISCASFVRGGSPTPPKILTEEECASLVGGQGCPYVYCACEPGSCDTTGCPTAPTCASDGAGGCVKVTTQSGMICNLPDSDSPNGCSEVVVSSNCATQQVGGPMPPYNVCNYPAAGNCANAGQTCGGNLYSCDD